MRCLPWMLALAVALAALPFMATTPAAAQGGSWGPPTRLDSTYGAAGYPKVAMNPAGNATAVWIQESPAAQIFASRYGPGTGWTSEVLISEPGSDAFFPDVAMDSSGNAFVVWWQWGGGAQNIHATRYSVGTGWNPPTLLVLDVGSDSNPDLAMDDTGNAFIVWQEKEADLWSVWAIRYESGIGWGPRTDIQANHDSHAGGARLNMDSGGNATVVWWQMGLRRVDAWAARYESGTGWRPAGQIESSDSYNAWWPEVAMDSHGGAMAVWYHWDEEANDQSVSANRYVSGLGWGIPELIENVGNDAVGAKVAVDYWGNAIVVWQELYFFTRPTDIYATQYTVGRGWDAAVLLDRESSDASAPSVGMDAAGNAVATWSQWGTPWPNLWAARYEVGSGWGDPVLLEAGSGSAIDPALDVAMNRPGNAVAVWGQVEAPEQNIFASIFEAGVNESWLSIQFPPDGSFVIAPGTGVTGAASPHPFGSALDRVEVSCDGGSTWKTANGKDTWSSTCSLLDGWNRVEARAVDLQGGTSLMDVVDVLYDSTAPVVAIGSPGSGAWASPPGVAIAGTASDVGSAVDRVEVSCDGGIRWNAASGPASSWTYLCTESLGIAPGVNVIRARAFDEAGLVSPTVEIVVNYDAIAPSVEISNPTDGLWSIFASVTIAGSADDGGGSGLSYIEVSCEGGIVWARASGTSFWSHSCGLVPGANVIRARAHDAAGGVSAVRQITVHYDDAAPSAIFESPADDFVTRNVTVVVAGVAADSVGGQLDRVEVSFDGGETWILAEGLEAWSASGTLRPGRNVLLVRAIDLAGRISDLDSITATYLAGTYQEDTPAAGWPVIIVALGVIVLVSVVLSFLGIRAWRRRS